MNKATLALFGAAITGGMWVGTGTAHADLYACSDGNVYYSSTDCPGHPIPVSALSDFVWTTTADDVAYVCSSHYGNTWCDPVNCTATSPCLNGNIPSYSNPNCWPDAIYCPPAGSTEG